MTFFFGTHSDFPSFVELHYFVHTTHNRYFKAKFMKVSVKFVCAPECFPEFPVWNVLLLLYPGVRGAWVLLRPIGRSPCARVKVHVVGFVRVRLRAVVDRRRVSDDLVHVEVVVAVRVLRVHSVGVVVVPPARLV